jgi:hypothetical protein
VFLLWAKIFIYAAIKLENISMPSNNIQIDSSISFHSSYSQVKTLIVELNNEAAVHAAIKLENVSKL